MVIEKLIKKLLREECSLEELKQLQEYWQGSDKANIERLLINNWKVAGKEKEVLKNDLKEQLWRSIEEACNKEKKQNLKVRWQILAGIRWAVAASVALLLAVGTYWWTDDFTYQNQQQQLVEQVNEGKTPMRIELEDGSVVWLSRNSRLIYPQPFQGKQRYAELIGEGFFEISKDQERPFLVQTGEVQTRVLGTVFNLKAEQEDSLVQIALVEGSVEVKWEARPDTAILIKPGEQITYYRKEQQGQKERFEEDAPYAWKNGVIYFQKANVQEVARTLEKWYDLPIHIGEDSHISGKLVYRCDTNKLTLEEVMKRISDVMDYYFEPQTDGSLLILKKK